MINITATKNNTNRFINSRFFLAVIPRINSIKPLVIIHLTTKGFSFSVQISQNLKFVSGPPVFVSGPTHLFVSGPTGCSLVDPQSVIVRNDL